MSNYTSKQAAQILDCTTRYVTELCKQGKFPGAAQDARGRWKIPQESVVALLATKETQVEILSEEEGLVPVEQRKAFFTRTSGRGSVCGSAAEHGRIPEHAEGTRENQEGTGGNR